MLPLTLGLAMSLGLSTLTSPLTKAQAKPADNKMALTGLAPAKLIPNLCLVHYRISTVSPECQAHFDQGLGYFYSYVWMEASRSFETATKCDPDCAMAWWGLSRALERWGRNTQTKALQKASDLKDKASYREQQLILARLQEKGMAPGVGNGEARKQAVIRTLDSLLAVHDDDEEGWYYRAQMAGGAGLFGGQVSSVPFYKALLHVNPLHPGANHELLHFYEGFQRPALGWIYAENYIKSSPGIPHPFHMQAHLATRLGRWDKTSDRSARAIELEQAYHKELNVKPGEDPQYPHHAEILTLSLTHDGRFAEARTLRERLIKEGIQLREPWIRLFIAERNWADALQLIDQLRKTDKAGAAYFTTLVYLRQGNISRATAEVESLRQIYQGRKYDNNLEDRLWETQGQVLCLTGDPESGLRLLGKVVERNKNDYRHHSWGNGAYYMESWGIAALQTNKLEVAEEAFLEALAHDRGSVRGALGMQILCERQGRTEEAGRFAELAQRCWSRASSASFLAEMSAIRGEVLATKNITTPEKVSGKLQAGAAQH
jgi:tetratricopeptide (TPR) repeat protein